MQPPHGIATAIPPPRPLEATAQDIPLVIVYEDDDLLVVDKPPLVPVHPGPGHERWSRKPPKKPLNKRKTESLRPSVETRSFGDGMDKYSAASGNMYRNSTRL